MSNKASSPVILFDGVCNLCNSTVQFIIRHDKKHRFRFAALQSAYGQRLVEKFAVSGDSVVLYQDGKIYQRSSAVLKIAPQISGAYWLLCIGYILPRFLRDAIYDLVARNRYRWFGKQDSCMMPTKELQSLFLSD
ncbi:thiol-disulfide oxidoreductase DCC family protein [Taibaiella soli]|uniref:Thiol-disulfide oxidoreductase n=1 Tax=Taibaiella soli TaxID=1649169 RepID=A0A2W2AQU5_9BACT|nr:thiol-disulfide oxidoreductase DCC family protein [Taibaiella soli]PZF74780.1 thiol-disulfide oxidoreductase [Taibaiella soli]